MPDPTPGNPPNAAISLAALPVPPLNAVKYKKVLWWVAETVIQSTEYLQYDYGMQMRALPTLDGDAPADEWRRFMVICDNTASAVTSDQAVFTIDVLNYTNGQIDSSWTNADYSTVAGSAIHTFLDSIKQYLNSRYTLTQVRAYRMAFNPAPTLPLPPSYVDKPFADAGPPDWVWNPTPLAFTGSATNEDVCCTSITEETPLRRHWGRFYTPPTATMAQTNGRFSIVGVDTFASAWHNALGTMAAQNFYTVVPNTRQKKQPIRTLSNVTGIHVDDIPDVIRRRRPKYVGYKRHYDEATP